MRRCLATCLSLTVACFCAVAQEAVEPATLQQCKEAMRAYELARGGDEPAVALAARRFQQACFPVPSAPRVLREPISTRIEPVPVPPSIAAPAPALPGVPSAPVPITSCDAGGCWDSHGQRYNGSGSILYNPAGKTCVRTADWIECR